MADVAAGVNKAQVAREVCAASAAFASCTHRRRPVAHFVDWYLVLAIGEAAPEEAVRRRYRHLALQLHPDKNRHPKAEAAFKLVSEAHACLTDKARRRAFDAERATAFCAACHHRSRSTSAAPSTTPTTPAATTTTSSSRNRSKRSSTASSHGCVPKPKPRMREVQNRLRDEWRVIDGCLRANNNNSSSSGRRQSFPLFDPSDHGRRIPGYPHARPSPQHNAGTPPPPFGRQGRQACCGGVGSVGICESPVYQISTAAPDPSLPQN